MNIEELGNLFSENNNLCIGMSNNFKKYSDEFRNIKNYHICSRKVDELKNNLYNSKLNKKEMEEIVKSVLIQIQNEK